MHDIFDRLEDDRLVSALLGLDQETREGAHFGECLTEVTDFAAGRRADLSFPVAELEG